MPINIYTEDYSLTIPSIINGYQVGASLQVFVEWDTIIGGEDYRVERSTSPAFTVPTTIIAYYGSATSFTDTVPTYGTTYYYRVKSVLPSITLESGWSGGYTVIVSSPPLNADFVCTPLVGDANLTIAGTDLSTGTPIAWLWDFGDGTTYAIQNPIHTYTRAGQYTVSLRVTSISRTSTKTRVNYITVNMLADFTATPVSGFVPLTVNFADISQGEPTNWDWDFGDGSPHIFIQNPVHVYTSTGPKTVTLIASRPGSSDTVTKVSFITVNLIAGFRVAPKLGYPPLTSYFTDKTTGYPPPDDWLWTFGDGNISTQQNPVNRYGATGAFSVTLRVSNVNNTSYATGEVQVTTLKAQLKEAIKQIADTYGSPLIQKALGSAGTEWTRDPDGKYHMLEVFIEGLANAIMERKIDRGQPFYGTLYKSLLAFVADYTVVFDDVNGMITGDSFAVVGSEFNDGGKGITGIADLTSPQSVRVSQQIYTETPASPLAMEIQPPNQQLSVDNTVYRTQATIHDTIPDPANISAVGMVKKLVPVAKIPSPTTDIEVRINRFIDLLTSTGWM